MEGHSDLHTRRPPRRRRRSRQAPGRPFTKRKLAAALRVRGWEKNPRRVLPEECFGVDRLLKLAARGDLHAKCPIAWGRDPLAAQRRAEEKAFEARWEADQLQQELDKGPPPAQARRLAERIEALRRRAATAQRDAEVAKEAAAAGRMLPFRSRAAKEILGLVGWVCIDLRKAAILGALPKLADVLMVCRKTLVACIAELEEEHLVVREDRFREPREGDKWRDGRQRDHRELTPALRAGGKLKVLWGNWKNRERREAEQKALRERRAKVRAQQQRRREEKAEASCRARGRQLLAAEAAADPHGRAARTLAVMTQREKEAAAGAAWIQDGNLVQPSSTPSSSTASSAFSGGRDLTSEVEVKLGGVDNGPGVPTHLTGDRAAEFWCERIARSCAEAEEPGRPRDAARGPLAASRSETTPAPTPEAAGPLEPSRLTGRPPARPAAAASSPARGPATAPQRPHGPRPRLERPAEAERRGLVAELSEHMNDPAALRAVLARRADKAPGASQRGTEAPAVHGVAADERPGKGGRPGAVCGETTVRRGLREALVYLDAAIERARRAGAAPLPLVDQVVVLIDGLTGEEPDARARIERAAAALRGQPPGDLLGAYYALVDLLTSEPG